MCLRFVNDAVAEGLATESVCLVLRVECEMGAPHRSQDKTIVDRGLARFQHVVTILT